MLHVLILAGLKNSLSYISTSRQESLDLDSPLHVRPTFPPRPDEEALDAARLALGLVHGRRVS